MRVCACAVRCGASGSRRAVFGIKLTARALGLLGHPPTLVRLDGNHVVSSLEEWDSREGWTAPFNMTYVWSYLPITGNTNPEICDYIL